MRQIDSLSDLQKRLDQLDSDLERVRRGKTLEPIHDAQAQSIKAKAQTLRKKMTSAEGLQWEAAMQSLRDDWDGLNKTFFDWATKVDKRFRER